MDKLFYRKQYSLLITIIISLAALVGFMITSGIVAYPLVLILISFFILYPYRKDSSLTSRLMILISLLMLGWLLWDLGMALLPFFISFIIAYLFDPLVNRLEKKKFPRWLSSLLITLILLAIAALIAIYVIPLIIAQSNNIIKRFSLIITDISQYIDSPEFYQSLRERGLPEHQIKEVVNKDVLPRIEDLFSIIFGSVTTAMDQIVSIATQLINAIIIPILTFYFLKDFRKMKNTIKNILEVRNREMLKNLRRINRIIRKYLGWQALAAMIVATVSSFVYWIFGVPYAIILGVMAGAINPIPYLSIIISCGVGIITVALTGHDHLLRHSIVILATINGLHFINAYFLEPNIAGKQVGLNPILLIISLFIFGGLFGLIGLLIAVPLTATLMMFFRDWLEKYVHKDDEYLMWD